MCTGSSQNSCDVKYLVFQLTPIPSFTGDKFCVLVGDPAKVTPMIYRLAKDMHQPIFICKLDPGVQLNEISFALQGDRWVTVLVVS